MGMLRISLEALLGHWRRHPLQFFSILTGLWLATALWTGVQALNSQARADYDRASAVLAGPARAQLVARQGPRFAQAVYVELRRSGWPVSPVLEGRLRFAGDEPLSVQLLGIEPLSLPHDTDVAGRPADDLGNSNGDGWQRHRAAGAVRAPAAAAAAGGDGRERRAA